MNVGAHPRVERWLVVALAVAAACYRSTGYVDRDDAGTDHDADLVDADLDADPDHDERVSDADVDADVDRDLDVEVDAGVGEPHVILVIIDGARFSETLGDPEHRFAPELARLAAEGCAPGPILNSGDTVTIAGMSAIHTGAWDAWRSDPYGEVYQAVPTHWEYFRKQRERASTDAFYVLEDLDYDSLWKPSRHAEYGQDYWPTFQTRGWSDAEVFDSFTQVIEQVRPTFAVLYLADVDAAGHGGSWARYTEAVSTADWIVGQVWELAQGTAGYAGRTTLLVTSDHGRHDDAHGGFSGHGDGCDGCRQVTFLAIGPDIDPGCVPASQARSIIDLTPTIGRILGYDATYSEGAVIEELFLN